MKKVLFCFTLLMLMSRLLNAQNLFYAKELKTVFFSEARIENIEAVSTKGVSLLNIATRELAFRIPIQSFKFSNGLMQEHFNENYMESDQYPQATFKGTITEAIDLSQEGTYQVNVRGQLMVHGVSQDRTIGGTIRVKARQIEVASAFIIPVKDHRIRIPNDKITKISQDIKVKVSAAYEPRN